MPQKERAQEQERKHGEKRGAEGGDSDAARKAPPTPADDSSSLGDTDQHSSADA